MRRREQPRPAGARPEPPAWCRSLVAGLRYAAERGHHGLSAQLVFLRAERARWCGLHDCYRPGVKTCSEANGSPCVVRQRAVNAA